MADATVNKLRYAFAVVVLTKNAGGLIDLLFKSIRKQNLIPDSVLVIDSGSSDSTLEQLAFYKPKIHVINGGDFNHGKTRQLALQLVDADIYVFLTQDVILVNENSLANLIGVFDDATVGCAYGRQLPHANATVLARHARLFNYPDVSSIKSLADKGRYGIKTCFNSNSFAAYRKSALLAVGGFPDNVILGEDVYVAAKMLQSGWKVAYCADAMVYHSHNYSLFEEFERYFDIGVFHQDNQWILQEFSGASGEGLKYVKSEWSYCIKKRAFFSLFKSFASVFTKFMGYKLGRHYKSLPRLLVKKLSMCKFYWS